MKIGNFSESLKNKSDFKSVYSSKNSKADRNIVVYVKENNANKNRIGISCSKKIGNSIVRHHMARLIREAYRLSEDMFQTGWDIVVVVRDSAKDKNMHDIQHSLLYLAGLHNILKEEKYII